jgi:two-component system, OmpR family, sensor histidine kinase QseC
VKLRSLQWRMLAALGLVIALAWGISIAMLVAYLSSGPSNGWHAGLHTVGNNLTKLLPESWTAAHNASPPGAAGPASGGNTQPSDPEGILISLVFNTIQLIIVGLLMWWAVTASLRPLRAMSTEIAKRKPFDAEPLSADSVPGELRPLILAFNSLLARVDTAVHAERQFIADAAHELRTPLAALHMQAEVALRAESLAQKDSALKKLLDVSQRSHRLAEQLLDLARLDAGLHTTGLHRTDLLDLARHVINEFSVQAANRGTRLLLAGSSCLANCDVDEMGTLIRNLVDNAIHHGRDGGTVEVRCGYAIRNGGRHPMLEVSDDGPGVPSEEHEAIFGRFYRASGSSGRGSGIGLSLVAGIAELHEAVIETGKGKNDIGFCVRIVFPRDD